MVSRGVLTEHFVKARRPVNNQARGDPALSTQEMQAVSTVWHCAVTTYHSWALSQPSAVWKHHSTYLSPPFHAVMLASEHTHCSLPTIEIGSFLYVFWVQLDSSPWRFKLCKQTTHFWIRGSPGIVGDIVELSNLSLSITTQHSQMYNKSCKYNTVIRHSWINILFWQCLIHYSYCYPY